VYTDKAPVSVIFSFYTKPGAKACIPGRILVFTDKFLFFFMKFREGKEERSSVPPQSRRLALQGRGILGSEQKQRDCQEGNGMGTQDESWVFCRNFSHAGERGSVSRGLPSVFSKKYEKQKPPAKAWHCPLTGISFFSG